MPPKVGVTFIFDTAFCTPKVQRFLRLDTVRLHAIEEQFLPNSHRFVELSTTAFKLAIEFQGRMGHNTPCVE